MKKIFLFVALFATTFGQFSFAQDNTNNNNVAPLLDNYYSVKDALIASNSTDAAANAAAFKTTINTISVENLPETSRTALLKDVDAISSTKDIEKQREAFSSFSEDMLLLVKTTPLTTDPIYKTYCPMKKTIWLSKETAIKNPYFGSSMLTCGKVTETIK